MESIGTSAESIAHAFVRAINRQDAEQVAVLMSPAHRFIDSLGKVIEGRDKMREGWAAYFRMVPDYSVAIEEIYPSDPVVIMIGVAQGNLLPRRQAEPRESLEDPRRHSRPHRRRPRSGMARLCRQRTHPQSNGNRQIANTRCNPTCH